VRVAMCRRLKLKLRDFSCCRFTWTYACPVPVDTILVRRVLHLQHRVVFSNVDDAHSVVARVCDDLRACFHKVRRTVDQGPGFNCRLPLAMSIGFDVSLSDSWRTAREVIAPDPTIVLKKGLWSSVQYQQQPNEIMEVKIT